MPTIYRAERGGRKTNGQCCVPCAAPVFPNAA